VPFLGIGRKSAHSPREVIESVWGDGIGSTPPPAPESDDTRKQAPHGGAQVRSNYAIVCDRVEEAARRVADLEGRLSAKREKVFQLVAQLDALQEAAVEAAVRGEEPTNFTLLEAALRDAQAGERILEEALNRAKASLRTAEAECKRAAQVEQDEKFADTLRELMQHAAVMAECHNRLSEIHKASDGRYSPSLLWYAFAPGNDYAQWLRNAGDFLNRPRPEKDAVSADCGLSLGAALTGNGQSERADTAANEHQVEEAGFGYSNA